MSHTRDEVAAKQLLAGYGIPVVEEIAVESPAEARAAAERLGFPVVLKGRGAELSHKTELGLVFLGLANGAEVEARAVELLARGLGGLEGFVVQRQVSGRRELVVGLTRDAQFGPVLMLGLGGVFAEALRDVSFALAPLGPGDLEEMITGLRSAALVGAFRGEAAIDRRQLRAVLEGLARLADEHPEIVAVDLNPLVAGADGRLTAVDALIVSGDLSTPGAPRPPVRLRELAAAYHPRSIVVVGASSQPGKWGFRVLANLLAGGFPGPVYLVGRQGGTIAGRPVYGSIAELPEPVDLAILTIPADAVLPAIDALAARGIGAALVISSGFAEIGEVGRRLEEELTERARRLGVLLVGPNTMGICNPHARFFGTGVHVRPEPGSTALVAQSGNLGVQLLHFARAQGIGIRAYCGSGNEAMVAVEDYMEAFERDEVTGEVVLYVESLKDPRRFFSSARRLAARKPVIVLKGGRTAAGSRAAASHTGALAADEQLFAAACRQAGVLSVAQPMELLDLSAAFSSLPLPRGARVAIVTMGGGWGVVAADLCQEHGLEIPGLPPAVVAQLDAWLPSYWSRTNPVDLVGQFVPQLALDVLAALAAWDGCDAIIHLGLVGQVPMMQWLADAAPTVGVELPPGQLSAFVESYRAAEPVLLARVVELMAEHHKPIVGVKMIDEEAQAIFASGHRSGHRAVVFQTPERAVRVLAAMARLARWREPQRVT